MTAHLPQKYLVRRLTGEKDFLDNLAGYTRSENSSSLCDNVELMEFNLQVQGQKGLVNIRVVSVLIVFQIKNICAFETWKLCGWSLTYSSSWQEKGSVSNNC